MVKVLLPVAEMVKVGMAVAWVVAVVTVKVDQARVVVMVQKPEEVEVMVEAVPVMEEAVMMV
jgi:hypothetical protein